MPWKETCPVDERNRFIDDYLNGVLSLTALCRHYSISRNGGIRWAGKRIPVSHILIELENGLQEVDHCIWDVSFGPECHLCP